VPSRKPNSGKSGRGKTAVSTPPRGDKKVVGKEARHGQDAWRISVDGRSVVITTSKQSKRTIDEAASLYGRALRRLADR